jgi:hypothetical protein
MSIATRAAAATNPLLNRAAVTNDPLRVRADGRTPQGKRIRDLYRSYWEAIGRPSNPAIQAAVLAASELMVAAEGARAQFLAGRGDVEQIVRLENLALRAVRAWGSSRVRRRRCHRSASTSPASRRSRRLCLPPRFAADRGGEGVLPDGGW